MFGLQFVNEVGHMQREIDHLFRGFSESSDSRLQVKKINFKVKDRGESYCIEASLPGLDADKLDISMMGRRLHVSGEFLQPEVPKDVRWHRQERSAEPFEETLQLTANLDAEKVEAEYRQGILKIILPKAASALPKKIEVVVS